MSGPLPVRERSKSPSEQLERLSLGLVTDQSCKQRQTDRRFSTILNITSSNWVNVLFIFFVLKQRYFATTYFIYFFFFKKKWTFENDYSHKLFFYNVTPFRFKTYFFIYIETRIKQILHILFIIIIECKDLFHTFLFLNLVSRWLQYNICKVS